MFKKQKQFPIVNVSKMRLVAEFSGYTTGPVLLGIGLGVWLDNVFATQWWFSIGGVVIGIGIGTILSIKKALELIHETRSDTENKKTRE